MKLRVWFAFVLAIAGVASGAEVMGADKTSDGFVGPPYPGGPIQKGATVLGFTAGFGAAHQIANSVPDNQFAALGVRIGKVLTDPWGPGFLKGNSSLSLEALPVFLTYDNEFTYGASFTLLFRQYFTPGSRWRPFMTLGAGALVSTDQVPKETSRVNFTPQAGLGLAYSHSDRTVFTFEYRFHHISNADTAELNPGINSSSFHFGVSIFR